MSSNVTRAVIADIDRRAALGARKYGTTLDRTDLTRLEWLNHAYEEALDMACYLKKLILDEDLASLDRATLFALKQEGEARLDRITKELRKKIQ